MKNCTDEFAWSADFKGKTWEDFTSFAAESLKNFDKDAATVFSAKLNTMCVLCRDLQKIQDQFACTTAAQFQGLAAARRIIEAGFTFKLEGILISLLIHHTTSPLVLKRHVNANILDAKNELASIIEGYTFDMKKLHPKIAAQVATQSSFSKRG